MFPVIAFDMQLRGMIVFLLALGAGEASAQTAPTAEQKAFQQCQGCHQIGPDAKNGMGPVLNGIIGRRAGTRDDYSYSPALKNSNIVWSEEKLREFIGKPQRVVPFTKMTFSGLSNKATIDLIVTYLKNGANGKDFQ